MCIYQLQIEFIFKNISLNEKNKRIIGFFSTSLKHPYFSSYNYISCLLLIYLFPVTYVFIAHYLYIFCLLLVYLLLIIFIFVACYLCIYCSLYLYLLLVTCVLIAYYLYIYCLLLVYLLLIIFIFVAYYLCTYCSLLMYMFPFFLCIYLPYFLDNISLRSKKNMKVLLYHRKCITFATH